MPKITKVEELIIAIGAEISGEFLVIDAQGIAHLMEETSDSVGTDDDTEVTQRHGNLIRSAPGPLQPSDGIAGGVVFEQAVEKQYGGPEFIGRHLENGSIDHRRNRPRGLPGAELIPSVPTIGGGVQEASGHLKSAQTSCAHQIAEGILDFGMERVSQFVGEPATRGLIGEGFDGGNQSAVAGKPNCITGPQACVVEAGGFAEGIVAAAMGIAGQVIYDSQ